MRRLAPGSVLAVIALAVAAPAATAATATPQPDLLLEPALDPANATVVYQPGLAYVGRLVQTGLWRSDDAGATFRPVMLGPPTRFRDAKAVAVAVGADGAVLVAEGDDVRRSTDGGASFTGIGTVPGLSELAVGAPPTLTPFAVVERGGEDGESSDRRLAGAPVPWPSTARTSPARTPAGRASGG